MKQSHKNPKWWQSLAWFLLAATTADVLMCFFSSWAVNAELIGKYNLGSAIGFAFLFAYLLYASVGLLLCAVAGMAAGYLLKYPIRKFMLMAVIALVPMVYLEVFG